MAQKYPGLYLYFDWLRGLEKMPPKIAMQIICNLFHYAEEGRKPAPLSETHYEIVHDLYLEQIKRSKRTSEVRRVSAYVRHHDRKSPRSYMDITDPEELRRALESDPDYRNDDIDELVNFRMLMLDKSKKKGRGDRMISPRSLWAACKYLQKVAKGLQKSAKFCKSLQNSAKVCKSLQKFQWKILHPLSYQIKSYRIQSYRILTLS